MARTPAMLPFVPSLRAVVHRGQSHWQGYGQRLQEGTAASSDGVLQLQCYKHTSSMTLVRRSRDAASAFS